VELVFLIPVAIIALVAMPTALFLDWRDVKRGVVFKNSWPKGTPAWVVAPWEGIDEE